MNEIEILFSNALSRLKTGLVDIDNYRADQVFTEFSKIFVENIKKYPTYFCDGRFESILFEELNNSIKNEWSYYEFLNVMKIRLDRLCAPCVILIPLNFIDDRQIKSVMELSENICLFKTEKSRLKYRFSILSKSIKTPLEKYFENRVYKLLLRKHIETAKDENFFNFPLLTVLVSAMNNRVIMESGRIVEAVYAFIRLLDFEKDLENGGWGYMCGCKLNPADVYGVYYNEEGISCLPKGDNANGYGYSFRFKFSPILDVSTGGFLESIDEFNKMIDIYIKCCFLDKNNYSDEQLIKISKWQNSIQMFNTAYEFASQERYDNAILMLLTILESVFIKNQGKKKENIILALQDFFANDNEFSCDYIRENIEKAYRSRNKFVHEGIGVYNEYIYAKSINSFQGAVNGMKPFAYSGIPCHPSNIDNIVNIFKIVIKVIRSYQELLPEIID